MWTPRYLYFLTLSTFCPRSDRWPSHFPPFLWSYSHTGLDDFSKTTILFLLLITYSSKHCRIICEFCSKSCHESLKSTSWTGLETAKYHMVLLYTLPNQRTLPSLTYLSGSLYSMRWYLLTFPVASLKVDLVCIQTAEHQETFSSVVLVQSKLFTPEPSSLHHDVRAIAIKLWLPWVLWSFWLQLCISQKHFDCDASIWSCNLVSCGHSRLQLPR